MTGKGESIFLVCKPMQLMDFLQLPLLNPTDTILRAMDLMQSADARAIVVAPGEAKGGNYVLQMNTAVMVGFKQKRTFLSQLGSGVILPDLSGHPSFRGIGESQKYWGFAGDAEAALDQRNTGYAVAASDNTGAPTVTIVTRHKSYAAQIRSANKVCVCNGPDRHTGDAPPLHNGQRCIDCQYSYICR
jgi:hypothetical protein